MTNPNGAGHHTSDKDDKDDRASKALVCDTVVFCIVASESRCRYGDSGHDQDIALVSIFRSHFEKPVVARRRCVFPLR